MREFAFRAGDAKPIKVVAELPMNVSIDDTTPPVYDRFEIDDSVAKPIRADNPPPAGTELMVLLHGQWVPVNEPVEPNIPPLWGKGTLPPEFVKYFGKDNGARLDFVQNQAIDKHGLIIVEIAKRLLALEAVDPNEVAKDCGLPVPAYYDGYDNPKVCKVAGLCTKHQYEKVFAPCRESKRDEVPK